MIPVVFLHVSRLPFRFLWLWSLLVFFVEMKNQLLKRTPLENCFRRYLGILYKIHMKKPALESVCNNVTDWRQLVVGIKFIQTNNIIKVNYQTRNLKNRNQWKIYLKMWSFFLLIFQSFSQDYFHELVLPLFFQYFPI